MKNIKQQIDEIQSLLNLNEEEIIEIESQVLVMSFLSEIEKLIKEENITRKELAKRVDKSASYISQLFNGVTIPNIKMLVSLGLALDKKFKVKYANDIELERQHFKVEGRVFDSSNLNLKFKREDRAFSYAKRDNSPKLQACI